jgi:hypothetical protein
MIPILLRILNIFILICWSFYWTWKPPFWTHYYTDRCSTRVSKLKWRCFYAFVYIYTYVLVFFSHIRCTCVLLFQNSHSFPLLILNGNFPLNSSIILWIPNVWISMPIVLVWMPNILIWIRNVLILMPNDFNTKTNFHRNINNVREFYLRGCLYGRRAGPLNETAR